MLKSGSTERHPFTSLLLLLLIIFAGAVLFTIIGAVLGASIYGLKPLFELSSGKNGSLDFLRLVQIFSSFGMFILPAYFFAKFESVNGITYLSLVRAPIILAALTILIMFSFGPMLEYSLELNKGMKLPGFLKGLEEWMLLKETQMEVLTKQLLIMDSPMLLGVNLLMLAIIPALGEELIFRGCLQKIFGRWTGNHHIAIWITAIIFSAIHFQFYGFIPRMLLGALFGYLLVWSGSLWLPIMAHFMNNAIAVVTAYVYQQKGLSLDKMYESDPVSLPVQLFSMAFFSALLWIFYTYSLKRKTIISLGTDGSRMD